MPRSRDHMRMGDQWSNWSDLKMERVTIWLPTKWKEQIIQDAKEASVLHRCKVTLSDMVRECVRKVLLSKGDSNGNKE